MTQNYIGVDLSKEWLDVYNPQNGFSRVENNSNAILAWIETLTPQDFLVFEATSQCDGDILRVASQKNLPFHRINPLHAWHFARSLNLAKTDRVDAKMLARLGAERRPVKDVKFDQLRADFNELSHRRNQLKRMETQEKNRLHKTRSQVVIEDIELILKTLKERISSIEKEIQDFLKKHPDLGDQVALLQSVPGIGLITSVNLLAYIPELGKLDRKKIASLAGLAPRARESGKWQGQRYTGQGRRHVRRALYMASLSAMRIGGPFDDFASRLREKGKAGKVIVIAIARKLLVLANAILREQKPFSKQNA